MHSDVAYLACARRLLAAPDAVYPQFATHNAHTLAAIYQMAGPAFRIGQYEFQCLHGMGEPLYEQVVARDAGGLARPCRIYAPVGTHETLLAYLVRRLLENGSNSSFVNRIANEAVPIDELVADPVAVVEQEARADGKLGLPHPAIALPPAAVWRGAAQFAGPRSWRTNATGAADDRAAGERDASVARRSRCSQPHPLRRSGRTLRGPQSCRPARSSSARCVEANAADADTAMAAAVAGCEALEARPRDGACRDPRARRRLRWRRRCRR